MTLADCKAASEALKRGILENDLGLKEAAGKINRSVVTVKRALKGSMGIRTAYQILKAFGNDPDGAAMTDNDFTRRP